MPWGSQYEPKQKMPPPARILQQQLERAQQNLLFASQKFGSRVVLCIGLALSEPIYSHHPGLHTPVRPAGLVQGAHLHQLINVRYLQRLCQHAITRPLLELQSVVSDLQ